LPYQLLNAFRAVFAGRKYRHRDSTIGDKVAVYLYEDLNAIQRSAILQERITQQNRVVNRANLRRGIKARRGDGTFGELLPSVEPSLEQGLVVARGPIATVEIGCEVKILAKAMIKQIARVINDLNDQVNHFRKGGGQPICVAIVGINHADECIAYEGKRRYKTDGKTNKHPYQEAREVEGRLMAEVAPRYDEFLILKYRATNVRPYPFEWLDLRNTELDYVAILTRIASKYDERFGRGAWRPR